MMRVLNPHTIKKVAMHRRAIGHTEDLNGQEIVGSLLERAKQRDRHSCTKPKDKQSRIQT